MEQLLQNMSEIINNNFWIAPIISFLAGVFTSITPCSLSSLPLVIGVVGGVDTKDTKKAFKISLVFALGMAITFTILGAMAGILGKLMLFANNWWYIVLGIIMVMMSLQMFEIITFIKPINLQANNSKKGYLGALFAGILSGNLNAGAQVAIDNMVDAKAEKRGFGHFKEIVKSLVTPAFSGIDTLSTIQFIFLSIFPS